MADPAALPDCPLIRQLLEDDEWDALSQRLVHVLPDRPWLAWDAVLPILM